MITFDFETRSYADLKKVGAWAYSEDPTTEVICAAYGIDSEPVQTWWPEKKLGGVQGWRVRGDLRPHPHCPHDLYYALLGGHTIEAHNVAFERAIWTNIMMPRYGWIMPEDEQWRDTMAVACYYSLPAALDRVAHVLGFEGKDPDGGRLITKYSKLYLKTAKTEIPDEDFKKFVNYCVKDVQIEQSVSDYLGDLPDRELPVFHLDQKINLRGLYLDTKGIECATEIVDQRADQLTKEFRGIVGFNPTQTAKVKDWFGENGLALENLQAGYLQDLMDEGEIPSGITRRALEIRLAINKASTKKLAAMARQQAKDGRAKFQTRYHGASTGRWIGSGFQPLNLKKGDEGMDPEQLVRDIMYGDAEYLDMLYGDAMDAVAKASRHWIMAEPGNQIYAGDYSSIEAIVLTELAGEAWKQQAFRDGVKIYELMADKIYGLPTGTVTKKTHPAERQDGKTGELAFGYQGALGAWLKFDNSGRHSDKRIIEICKAWRSEHPAIVALWRGLQNAAIEATRTGALVTYRSLGFEVVDKWLTMILPGGKRLWYWKPQITMKRPRWCNPETKPACFDRTCRHTPEPQLSYMAQKEGQWKRVSTYGGKLTENACQAVSREILVPAMMRCEDAGYHVILTVYDEIVSEVPLTFGSEEEFVSLMEGPLPEWAEGWPVTVDAWIGDRYKK